MWFSQKLEFSAFLGILRKDWDCRQNIWISGARGHLKSPKKRPEIHKNARNPDFCEIPIFGKPHGKAALYWILRKNKGLNYCIKKIPL